MTSKYASESEFEKTIVFIVIFLENSKIFVIFTKSSNKFSDLDKFSNIFLDFHAFFFIFLIFSNFLEYSRKKQENSKKQRKILVYENFKKF